VRDAVARVAFSSSVAALYLAPPAPAMPAATLRVAASSLGAALVLAAFAAAMRHATPRAALSQLEAALQLTQPPAHGPSGSPHHLAAETLLLCGGFLNSRKTLLCGGPITAVTHPLSVLNTMLVHTGHQTHDGGSARAGQTLGMQAMSRSRWSRALGRGTYGGWVVGQDGQGLLRTLYRQVHRLLARRAAFPPLPVRTHPHRCTASTARRRNTLELTC
jgi:hypothetical protein